MARDGPPAISSLWPGHDNFLLDHGSRTGQRPKRPRDACPNDARGLFLHGQELSQGRASFASFRPAPLLTCTMPCNKLGLSPALREVVRATGYGEPPPAQWRRTPLT